MKSMVASLKTSAVLSKLRNFRRETYKCSVLFHLFIFTSHYKFPFSPLLRENMKLQNTCKFGLRCAIYQAVYSKILDTEGFAERHLFPTSQSSIVFGFLF